MYLRKHASLYIYIRIVLFKNWFYFVQSRFVDFPIYVERFTIQNDHVTTSTGGDDRGETRRKKQQASKKRDNSAHINIKRTVN